MNQAGFKDREFTLTDDDFRALVQIVHERTGIALADHKKQMVYSRLTKRLREFGMRNFSEYITFLKGPEGDSETINFVNAITTNLTSFFREPHHFEHLAEHLKARAAKASKDKRLRIWSAGCSTGAEPYSIAMTVLEHLPLIKSWDVKILATDIDTNVLDTGSNGVYREDMFRQMPQNYIGKYVKPVSGERDPSYRVTQEVKSLVHFKRLNLLEGWPMRDLFDVIFCRNVVIYFNKDTQRTLFDRYANQLKPDAFLYIGHSENLHGVSDRFKSCGRTVYQRIS